MNTITQDLKYRQSILRYTEKHGVTKRHPLQHHPNQHTDEEIKLIQDIRCRNPSCGLVVFWVKLRQRGYKRSISGLYRCMRRLNLQAESSIRRFALTHHVITAR